MNIAIVCNHTKPDADSITEQVVKRLHKLQIKLYTTDAVTAGRYAISRVNEADIYRLADVFIVIGGDGTIIHTAKQAAIYHLPVLGINAGRIGYLAGLERDELELLDQLVRQEYTLEHRMMLSVEFGGQKNYCLNDVIVSKDGITGMIDLSVHFGSDRLTYRADGLITATPTGSTAYSLSAGGPVVDPSLACILLNPICPQSLFARTMVLSAAHEFVISAKAPEGCRVLLSIDGEQAVPITSDCKLSIRRCEEYEVRLIRLNREIFFNTLSDKFSLLK